MNKVLSKANLSGSDNKEYFFKSNYCHLLMENVADGICIFQDRKLVFVNTVFTQIFGYTEAQLIGKKPSFLFREDYKQQFTEVIEKLEKGFLVQKFAAPCIRQDGMEIWIEEIYNIIEWKNKPAILATVRDITQLKLREINLENEKERLFRENIKLKNSIKERYQFGDMIGKSNAMQGIYERILKASEVDADVIIYGESGTGKDLIARSIHNLSKRSNNPFIPVNCGAIPESLFESEFFGHRKGAFTGAYADKRGFFDLAHGGTLFLDEVTELSYNMQVKLLRAIEGSGYTPLGDAKTRQTDVRIISATNIKLKDILKKGVLREDFLYRIHVIPIHVPPLRDRKEDIPLLIDHFMKHYGKENRPIISGTTLETLYNHKWPGNIRELQNVLKRYVALNRLDFIGNSDPLINHTGSDNGIHTGSDNGVFQENMSLREHLEFMEKKIILNALKRNCWHRAKTADMLGIQERTLYRKMKQHLITKSYS